VLISTSTITVTASNLKPVDVYCPTYDNANIIDQAYNSISMVSTYQFRLMASLKKTLSLRCGMWVSRLACGCRIAPADTALHKHKPVPLDTSALNDTQYDHDDRDNQENVNESADCVRGNQTQYPEDD